MRFIKIHIIKKSIKISIYKRNPWNWNLYNKMSYLWRIWVHSMVWYLYGLILENEGIPPRLAFVEQYSGWRTRSDSHPFWLHLGESHLAGWGREKKGVSEWERERERAGEIRKKSQKKISKEISGKTNRKGGTESRS